jgi:hypothetical protein
MREKVQLTLEVVGIYDVEVLGTYLSDLTITHSDSSQCLTPLLGPLYIVDIIVTKSFAMSSSLDPTLPWI